MAPSFAILHLIIMSAEFLTGITANGFLIIMNCNELIKCRKLIPMQILLTCIGMARFGLQVVLMVQTSLSLFCPVFYKEKVYGAMLVACWTFFSSLSFWFAACLSVFYCLKISGFPWSCFFWLKFRISQVILWLLLGSLLASASIAVLSAEVFFSTSSKDDVLRNTTAGKTQLKVRKISEILLVNLALLLPLGIFVLCIYMLFMSLSKHVQRLSHGFRSVSTEAHVNALRMVITFFCFFITYFAAFMTNLTFLIPYGSQWFFVMKDIMAAYPSGHSVIIICSNSKLQQPFRRILCLRRK
ncbi:taste receptor type 2 member 9-like [Ochotona princeps]|uniref:taste receptor type 2 member 9-like n=1 Tax=Ochotona princeps TaxID=9978 RepID=UPI0027148022|nr:taste receptor type 2 member 9-like [Ochotona princeps]